MNIFKNGELPFSLNEDQKLFNSIKSRFVQKAKQTRKLLIFLMIINWMVAILISTKVENLFVPGTIYFWLSLFSILILFKFKPQSKQATASLGFPISLSLCWLMVLSYNFVISLLVALSILITQNTKGYYFISFITFLALLFCLYATYSIIYQEKKKTKDDRSFPLLFLWEFETKAIKQQLNYFGTMWRFVGPLTYLRGGAYKSDNLIESIKSIFKKPHHILDSSSDFQNYLQHHYHTQIKKGSLYANYSVLCSYKIWKECFLNFLQSTQVILMYLGPFSESSNGCEYEISQIIQSKKLEKTLFLFDQSTDIEYFKSFISEQLSLLESYSPIDKSGLEQLYLYQLNENVVKHLESSKSNASNKSFQSSRKMIKQSIADSNSILNILSKLASK